MKDQLSKPLLYLMAITAGASVGNLFSSQPILPLLQSAFHVTTEQIGLVPTATQIGYALGILFIIPLGDMLSRRALILSMMALTVVACVALFFSRSYVFLVTASGCLGIVSVSTQILTPLAAQLSDDSTRGRNMGTIISGMLLGVLFSRTISGYLSDTFGWASVYLFGAILSALLTVALAVMLPQTTVPYRGTYGALMKSLYHLVKKYSVLRESMLFGALLFAAFNCFWGSLDFLLLQPPFHYGAKEAGLFGLIGAAGAFVAPLAGRIADKGEPRKTIGIAVLLCLIAFAAMWFGHSVLGVLIAGTALMDMGVQAGHVTNQTRIYALDPNSRSRFATIYVFAYFVGAAFGSVGGSWSFARWGWTGPSVLSILVCLSAGVVYFIGLRKDVTHVDQTVEYEPRCPSAS
jgi:predicted MFS family arabinose efflux permease